jgi:hypothetical protein
MSEGVAVDEAAKAKSGESHFAILLFLALALMSALLNSSAPTPLYPLYQHELALSSVSLTVIYGAYAAGVLISLFGVGKHGRQGQRSAQHDCTGAAGGVGRGLAVFDGRFVFDDVYGASVGRDRHRGFDRCG